MDKNASSDLLKKAKRGLKLSKKALNSAEQLKLDIERVKKGKN